MNAAADKLTDLFLLCLAIVPALGMLILLLGTAMMGISCLFRYLGRRPRRPHAR